MTTSICIIGGGINGLLSAIHLRRRGHRVRVLDAGPLGGESSWAGAGILAPLLPWDYGPEVNALTERGRALWPDLAAELAGSGGTDPEYRACGMRVLQPEDPRRALDWCQAHGWPADYGTLPQDNHPALWLPGVAQVRNPRVLRALLSLAGRLGVELAPHTPVSRLHYQGARLTAVEFAADTYVLCAGAWSGRLLGNLGKTLPVAPVKGQIILLRAAVGTLPHIIYQRGQYLVPRADGRVLVGSTLEDAGFDKTPTAQARDRLLRFAASVWPALDTCPVERHWAGLRPGSPGNIPFICRHPRLENLYINTGHFRYGVTMAPAAAELLDALLAGEAPALNPHPYAWADGALDVV